MAGRTGAAAPNQRLKKKKSLWGLFSPPDLWRGEKTKKKQPNPGVFLRRWRGFTCEDVSERVAARDLQRRVLGAEDIEEEGREAADDAQEAEGGDDPEQQHCLRVHAVICAGRKRGGR